MCGLCLKEWAIHTGRYRQGIDDEDWVSWKTRLRCALNKATPGIVECKSESRVRADESDPFKVYEFKPRQREYKSNVFYCTAATFVLGIYRVDHKKRPKFFPLGKTNFINLGKIALALDRALSALYLLIIPLTSLKTSLRNTGWRRHTPKISLSESDVSPERLYRWRSHFLTRADGEHQSFWNRKTNIFFINSQKTKVDQNGFIDLLKTSLLPECRRHYPGMNLNSCKTVFCHTAQSDVTVSMTEYSTLHCCWWMRIIFSRS